MSNNISYKSDENVKVGQLILEINNKPVAYATEAKLAIATDAIDTSNKMDGSWKSVLAGKKSFTVSSNSLLTDQEGTESYKELIAAQIAGAPIPFKFGTMKSTEDPQTGALTNVEIDPAYQSYSGNIIITSNELNSQNGDLAKHDLQAQGSGPLIPVTAVAGNGGGDGH